MAGPGIRYFEMARALAQDFNVTLAVPNECDLAGEGFSLKTYNSRWPSHTLKATVAPADAVVAQALWPDLLFYLKRHKIKYIADLYDPVVIEVLEYLKNEPPARQRRTFDFHRRNLLLQVNTANHLLCATPTQRDFYLGILSGQGLITPREYSQSDDLTRSISLLPFGLPKDPPKPPGRFKFEELYPAIRLSDKVVYWGGGIWNWFDPLTAIKAIEQISRKRSDIKLVFLGAKHPNKKIKAMAAVTEAVEYCRKHDLLDRFVFFNFDWTPYEERAGYLARANIGISTHRQNLETHFSFRTRILDYLWAELPMVLTEGDALSEMVREKNLGAVIKASDVPGAARAIIELADNGRRRDEIKRNIRAVKDQYCWERVVANLADLIKRDTLPDRPLSYLKLLRLAKNFYWAGMIKKLNSKSQITNVWKLIIGL